MSTIPRRLTDPFGRKRETATGHVDEVDASKEEIFIASQWRLMWLKFKRHKLAMVGMFSVLLLYLIVAFNGFLSPYTPEARTQYPYAAPNGLHFFRDGAFDPHVKGLTLKADPATMS